MINHHLSTNERCAACATTRARAQPAPNRFISNTVRRPYATPGGIRQTLRPSTAPRSLSTSVSVGGPSGGGRVVSPLTVPTASGSGSGSSTPDDDNAPAIPPVPRLAPGNVPTAPHTSYQPRTLPLTQSASVGSMPSSTPAGSISKRPTLSDQKVSPDSTSPASAVPRGIDHGSMDTTMQMDRAMAQLVSLLKDDSDSDDGFLAEMEGKLLHTAKLMSMLQLTFFLLVRIRRR